MKKRDELEIDKNQFTAEITITREFFYNNDWGVYSFETTTPLPNIKPEEMITETLYCSKLAGNVQRLDVGEVYNATMVPDFNGKFKQWQFKPIIVNSVVPTSIENQQKFLMSVLTSRQAATILEHYPNIVADVMEGKDDIDFDKLKGITPNNWISIKNKIIDNFVISDILALLSPLGVTYNMIKKLIEFEHNPHLLKQKLGENPYILTQVKGLGFKKVDKLALQLNPEFINSKVRAIAYIKYFLEETGNNDGHTWVTYDTLKDNFVNNVAECMEFFDEILQQEQTNSLFLHIENKGREIGLKKNYEQEEYIAYKLAENNVLGVKVVSDEIIERGIAKANEFQGFDYDNEQIEIIKQMVNGSGVQILTAKAGSGKTTLARGLLNIYQEAGYSINTCALSARAAIVIKESTGFLSSTIHRMLGGGFGGFMFNQNNPLYVDVCMIDEVSMISASLFKSLIEALPPTTKILIVGDGGQLPSIGCGNVLNDLITLNDERICTINYLKKIYRQAMDSAIIVDANKIRDNINPIPMYKNKIVHGELKDMYYMFFDNKEDIYNNALKLFYSTVDKVGLDNVVIACPRREGALNSAKTFNIDIQDTLLKDEKEFIQYGDLVYKKGCKVMQIENNYDKDIFNGEIGYIIDIGENGKNIVVDYNGKQIKYIKSELSQIDYAYSMTIHKLQGGSYRNVIITLDKSHYIMLNNSLVYTAITRASKKCCMLAEPFAFKQGVETSVIINRHTYLPTFDVDIPSDCLTKYIKSDRPSGDNHILESMIETLETDSLPWE